MKTRIIAYVLPILMLLAVPLAGEVNNSLAAFMRMGVGARVIAMGEAGSAITSDVVSGYWNPAGLMRMKDFEVGTNLSAGLNYDRHHAYASLGNRFGFGALALSWINAGVSDLDGYDDNGEPTGTFSTGDNCFALSYANSIGPVSFGVTPKFYLSSVAGESESGLGVDAGLQLDVNQYLQIGVMGRDLYAKYGEVEVPYQISAGLALYPLVGVTLAADAKLESEEDPSFSVGAEYWTSIGHDPEADSKLSVVNVSEANTWEDVLSSLQTGLRLGFNDGRFSAGTGIRFRNFQLDYVFRLNNHEIFADDHILSLIMRF